MAACSSAAQSSPPPGILEHHHPGTQSMAASPRSPFLAAGANPVNPFLFSFSSSNDLCWILLPSMLGIGTPTLHSIAAPSLLLVAAAPHRTYLPSKMLHFWCKTIKDELNNLRGDDITRKYKEWDRVYLYDYYNDLGEPDKGYPRPVLGGTQELPYPRIGRSRRPPTKTEPRLESRIPQYKI
ncbi:unnamed protein product [Triticum turgidum subsp. durum]|uniref:Lipoxygenase domain-containing protein n=1 Tax=Triticum turgidum subsp. durum TaxID=4567 RepID=A0A9R0TIH5_TRITD|nr:unnamed protein product [Triticum turgidum subsp. durum]